MKIENLFILFVLAFLCMSCSSVLEPLLTSIKINKHNELAFFGSITRKNVNKIKQIYKEAEIKPTVLRINSTGGDGIAAGILGDWIHFLKLDVKVIHRCFSACANYVFPAGERSLLGKYAMLGWHGSFQSQKFNYSNSIRISTEEVIAEHGQLAKKELKELRDREKSFYQHLGIDPNLPIYGESYEYRHLHANLKYDGEYEGFYYSVKDMKAMGLNIVLLDGEWHGDYPSTSRYKKCYRVTLSDIAGDLAFLY